VQLTWLGQSGFVVETADGRLLIDPFEDNAVRAASVVDEAMSFGPALHVIVPARYVPLRLG
jgi:L-ascorbate metabolism protein UlaG (beta-lactamase superfamily)